MKQSESYEGFKLITQKTMDLVNQKEVVLPSTYRVVFSSLAKKYHVDIGAESIRSNEEINEEVYSHVLALDANTNRAIEAIHAKDEAELTRVLEETKRLQQEVARLREIAYEDSLTRTLNRRWLERFFLDETGEFFAKEGVMALIDLNDFKQINDLYGHAVGDKVLIHLAGRLMQLQAHVIRYGGDEFLLIFERQALNEVHDIVNVMRELHRKRKIRTATHEFQVSFAYGIAPFEAGERFSEVIAKADAALYEDKGRIKRRIA